MSDENPNLDIEARLNPEGVVAGAAKAKEAIKEVADVTAEAGESSEKAADASSKEAAAKDQVADASEKVAQATNTEAAARQVAAEATSKATSEAAELTAQQTRAAEAAAKWGVSTEVAAAALRKIDATTKAAEVNALVGKITMEAEAREKQTAATQAETLAVAQNTSAEYANAEATQEVGAQQEIAAEHAEKMVKALQAQRAAAMQTVFQAHRLMEGFKDISEGGRLATQGFVDIEETVQRFLPPMAQVGLALASAAGLLVMMATRHRHAAGEAKEHASAEKESAEEVKRAWEATNEALASDLKEIEGRKFWDGQTAAAHRLTEEIKAQAEAISLIEAAEGKLLKAQQDLEIATLNRREQEELAGKTGDDETLIKQKYAGLKAEAATGNELERKDLEIRHAEERQGLLERLKVAHDSERAAAVAEAQRANDAATAQLLGIDRKLSENNPQGKNDYEAARDRENELAERKHRAGTDDSNGGVIPSLTTAEQIELNNLQNGGVESRRQKQLSSSAEIFDEQLAAAKKKREELEKATELVGKGDTIKGMNASETEAQVKQWTDQEKALGDYIRQIETYQNLIKQKDEAGTNLHKIQLENEKFGVENDAKIKATQTEIEALNTERKGIVVTGQAKGQENANAGDALAAKETREARDAKLATSMEGLEQALKHATTETQRRHIESQLAHAKAQQDKNKTDDHLAGLTIGASPKLDPIAASHIKNREAVEAQIAKIDEEIRTNADVIVQSILKKQRQAFQAQLDNAPWLQVTPEDLAKQNAQRVRDEDRPKAEGDLADAVRAEGAAKQKNDADLKPDTKAAAADKRDHQEAVRNAIAALKSIGGKDIVEDLKHLGEGAAQTGKLITDLVMVLKQNRAHDQAQIKAIEDAIRALQNNHQS